MLSGAHDLLPKGALLFKRSADLRVNVLDPIPTTGLGPDDVAALGDRVHALMSEALAAAHVP